MDWNGADRGRVPELTGMTARCYVADIFNEIEDASYGIFRDLEINC